MTDTFAKFYKWMTPLKNGYRSIKDDAPNEIKKEAKKPMKNISKNRQTYASNRLLTNRSL